MLSRLPDLKYRRDSVQLFVRQRYEKKGILPHLSTAKRGYVTQNCLFEVVNAILYKLKRAISRFHVVK